MDINGLNAAELGFISREDTWLCGPTLDVTLGFVDRPCAPLSSFTNLPTIVFASHATWATATADPP
jgi:hypothetical protein